ncbi:hypothetical protein ACFLXB_06700 [Chloroflexota bacterium]
MSTNEWSKLTEVYGQLESDNFQSLLKAYGINSQVFQESVGKNFGYPTSVGKFALVQIYVQTKDLLLATELLEKYIDQNSTEINSMNP